MGSTLKARLEALLNFDLPEAGMGTAPAGVVPSIQAVQGNATRKGRKQSEVYICPFSVTRNNRLRYICIHSVPLLNTYHSN